MSTTVAEPAKSRKWLKVLEGLIWILMGLFLLASPAAAVETIFKLMAVFLVALGFFLIAEIFIGGLDVGWGWLVAGGIFAILSGLLCLQNPMTAAFIAGTTLAMITAFSMIVLGIMLMASGHGILGAIAGIAVILLGIVLVFNPLETMMSLPTVAGILSLVAGGAIIIKGFTGPKAEAA